MARMAHILSGDDSRAILSEQECLRAGGHCFESTGEVLTSNPPQYPEKCKHCLKGRIAVPREAFTYRDWPAEGGADEPPVT
jgi:hypothetical protein